MEILTNIIDFTMNLDKSLLKVVQTYGSRTYMIVFAIIFCETGLVVTPFLPGDSLLFVIGALGALGILDFKLALLLLVLAAVAGNILNFSIGNYVGRKAFALSNSRLIKREHLEKTQAFYAKHGGKAIVLSRFLPIFRTFVPFVAGISKMNYWHFLTYNLVGGVAWVCIFMLGGYYFGNIPVVKNNFTVVILGIILISMLPAIISYLRRDKTASVRSGL